MNELSLEDREFVLKFLLVGGSLKELAQDYGVSYPTIRARLDAIIERAKASLEKRPREKMAELLAQQVERGEISARTAKSILELHRRELRQPGP